jgi:hypothetical protein
MQLLDGKKTAEDIKANCYWSQNVDKGESTSSCSRRSVMEQV